MRTAFSSARKPGQERPEANKLPASTVALSRRLHQRAWTIKMRWKVEGGRWEEGNNHAMGLGGGDIICNQLMSNFKHYS